MPVSRPQLTVPLTLLAVISLLLIAVAPVLAAPADSGGRAVIVLAQPEECDEITVNEDGDIVVDEVTLTEEQLALLDADVLAALRLTAAAGGAGCVDVEIGAEAITVSAEIQLCSVRVAVDADDNVTVEGVEIDADLLDAELLNLLRAAAAADAEACLQVEVTENEVIVIVQLGVCVTATANDDGSVTVLLGGVEIVFPEGSIVDEAGVLEGAVDLDVGLFIAASLALETDELVLEGLVPEQYGCPEPGPFGEVFVAKVIDADADPGTVDDQEPAPGWTFDFGISDGETVDEFASPTTDEDGHAYFRYTTDQPTSVLTVTEQLRPGYELIDASCRESLGEGEIGEPLGEWTGRQVTFAVEAEALYECSFVNARMGPAPTAVPSAAPTASQGPETNRPTITLPPTDVQGSATSSLLNSLPLVLVTLGLVVSGTLLLTLSYGRKR